ncbi:MAG: ATP-binding protein/SpoIIE family protein phosphatase [Polyangiaceae bacterium]|nr:ATP-binding protein/SpoIIE family protein phosphatase [Polyangiaceae bacterium]
MKSVSVVVTDASGVGAARRSAAQLAGAVALEGSLAANLALVVTELGSNLVKHARGGEIIVRELAFGGARGVEVLALDRGPGMADVARCLRDGHSTAGTRGAGLGAVTRLASRFEVHSELGRGTAIAAQLWPPAASATPASGVELGAVCVAQLGETVCGDAWAVEARPGRSRFLVADGLGHGPHAAEASDAAVAIFRQNPWAELVELLMACHAGLGATRGAALAVAELDLAHGRVDYVGVGNIAGFVASPEGRHGLTSHNGIVGQQLHKVQAFGLPWPPGGLLVMHSDGLTTRVNVAGYAGAFAKHPSLLAGLFYRDFGRGRDDATVLVAREASS